MYTPFIAWEIVQNEFVGDHGESRKGGVSWLRFSEMRTYLDIGLRIDFVSASGRLCAVLLWLEVKEM